MKKISIALGLLMLIMSVHIRPEADATMPTETEAKKELALTDAEKASLAPAKEVTVSEQDVITLVSSQDDSDKDDNEDDDKDDDRDDDDDNDDDDDEAEEKQAKSSDKDDQAPVAATPVERPKKAIETNVKPESKFDLSPKIEAHLKEAHDAIATLKTDVEGLRAKYYDAPRNSDERRTLRKHLDKLDKRIKKLEKHADKIDRVWDQCALCRS